MKFPFRKQWLPLIFLLVSTCLLSTYAIWGGVFRGISRSIGSRASYPRPAYKPSLNFDFRPRLPSPPRVLPRPHAQPPRLPNYGLPRRPPNRPLPRGPNGPPLRGPNLPPLRGPNRPPLGEPNGPSPHGPNGPSAPGPNGSPPRGPNGPSPYGPPIRGPNGGPPRGPNGPSPYRPPIRGPNGGPPRVLNGPPVRGPNGPPPRGPYGPPPRNRPYAQQPLGGYVWKPHHGVPAPVYMKYGGIPTGRNMHTMPHKQQGFIGSLLSAGKQNPTMKHKYHGSYPSPYGDVSKGVGVGKGFLGKHEKSASMQTIFPYITEKMASKLLHLFPFIPMIIPYLDFHIGNDSEEIDPKSAKYFDIYNDDYAGKCQRPIKKEYSEIKCKATFEAVYCNATCEEGYQFSGDSEFITHECWHVAGVWRLTKNFPDCKPACENNCMNGGECIRPGVCKCPAEYRGSRCQVHKSNVSKCNSLDLIKKEKVGWVCYHSKNESVCKVSCKIPRQFESPSAEEYKCAVDGVWKPDRVPHCVVKEKTR